jgi:hypothetical protein
VTSIERTAYPRFRRAVPVRELHESFTPGLEEIAWAREPTRSSQGLLTLLVLLKSFQRLGCFPDLFEVPVCVVDHVRRAVGLPATIELATEAGRTGKRYRDWVRRRVGVAYDPAAARKLAEQVIEAAAQVKDNPADLINVALEELVRARLELPGYSTLDELAATVRTRVNEEFYDLVYARLTAEDVEGLLGLLVVDPVSRRSRFDDAKRTAGKATLSRFREHLAQLAWLDGLGATGAWVAGVPAAKVSHFAAQARAADAADMADLEVRKRVVLIACLIHTARIRGRDELATMFCKRMANIHKQARDRFEALRESSRAQTEHLVEVFGDVLASSPSRTCAVRRPALPRAEPRRPRASGTAW